MSSTRWYAQRRHLGAAIDHQSHAAAQPLRANAPTIHRPRLVLKASSIPKYRMGGQIKAIITIQLGKVTRQ